MPTIYVIKESLFSLVGKEMTDQEFTDLCFQFGLEVEITDMRSMPHRDVGTERDDQAVYKIDVPANRYDLLCVEGVARAIRAFLGLAEPTTYHLLNASSPKEKIVVKSSTKVIRPYVVCAIIRNMKFDTRNYNSFISLQDKLHATLCRNRKFVAIGTHDYDTIKGPFVYEAKAPKDIKFKALNQEKEMTAEELMKLYETDLKLKEFIGLIKDSPVYPVIYDSAGTVLSMPPIINGDHSKITLKTTNVFIECTALDLTKAVMALNEVVCMFSQYATPALTAEAVSVIYDDKTDVAPKFETRDVVVDLEYVHRITGCKELTTAKCVALLKKMDMKAEVISEKEFKAIVPPHRADILHKCDVAEDVVIAYGFNNLNFELPQVNGTCGKQLPISKLINELRKVCTSAKYNECLTLCLISKEEHYTKMQKRTPDATYRPCVMLSNPISKECDIARTSLLPGLLKCLKSNIDVKLPIRLFEIGDVVLLDSTTETGARNSKRLASLYCGANAGFEYTNGLLDYVMTKLGVPFKAAGGYSLRIGKDTSFVENAQTEILHDGKPIGIMGIISPKVLAAFDLAYPVSMMEVDLDYLANVFFH